MNFTQSYEQLKSGNLISREEWNGVFLWLKPKAVIKSEMCYDPILKMIAESNGGKICAEQTICKFDITKMTIVSGWVPQQEDIAADDWAIAKVACDKNGIKVLIQSNKKDNNDGYVGDLFDGVDIIRKPKQ